MTQTGAGGNTGPFCFACPVTIPGDRHDTTLDGTKDLGSAYALPGA